MCTCNQNSIGNSNPIADAFNRNQAAVKRVFTAYGMGSPEIEPTPFWAEIGTDAFGLTFARDVAFAAAGISDGQDQASINNYDGNLVDSIFKGISGLGVATGSILTGVGALKAGEQGNPITIFQQPNGAQGGQPQVIYAPQPNQAATDQKVGGFSTGQIVLLASVLLIVVGAMFWLSRNPVKP